MTATTTRRRGTDPVGIDTGVGRLIVKAALHWRNDCDTTRQDKAIRTARLLAFGEVADDVLGIAMTPHGFAMAIRAALLADPWVPGFGSKPSVAEAARLEWGTRFATDVLARLGENDPTRGQPLAP